MRVARREFVVKHGGALFPDNGCWVHARRGNRIVRKPQPLNVIAAQNAWTQHAEKQPFREYTADSGRWFGAVNPCY